MRLTDLKSSSGIEAQMDSIEKSRLNSLKSREQNILYQKRAEQKKLLSQGKSLQDIQESAKEYDEKISAIEQEISKIVSSQKQKALNEENLSTKQTGSTLSAKLSSDQITIQKSSGGQSRASGSPSLQTKSRMLQAVQTAQKKLKNLALSGRQTYPFYVGRETKSDYSLNDEQGNSADSTRDSGSGT